MDLPIDNRIQFGECDDCGAMLCDGDAFYGLEWQVATLGERTIAPEGNAWLFCCCPRCSLGYDLGAIEGPGWRFDPGRGEGLDCLSCGTRPEEGDLIACVRLLKYGEVGLHAPEYLLAHYLCLACFPADGADGLKLARPGR